MFPRRRDVREGLMELADLLWDHYIEATYAAEGQISAPTFDKPFLTKVRDYLRAGKTVAEALGQIADEEADLPGLRHHPDCQD